MTWFSYLHPLTKCIYLVCLALCVMATMNPFCLAAVFAVLFVYLRISGAGGFSLRGFYGFLAAAMILLNLLFNHRGVHVLFYLFDRPVTLESLIWGLTSALLVLCIILISALWSKSIAVDEFLFVFGRLIPKTALLICMTLSFSALFLKRLGEIQLILKIKGIDISKGSLKKRLGDGAQILNALVAYSLESALISALSMKTRGYGLKKRTSLYSYRLRRRDLVFAALTCLLTALILLGVAFGHPGFQIFPRLRISALSPADCLLYLMYFLLSAAPLFRVGAYAGKTEKEAPQGCRS